MIKAAVCVSLGSLMLVGCARPERPDGGKPVLTRTIALAGVGAPRSDVGVPGRLDHFAYDPASHRLFMAALENGSLEVVNLDTGARVKSITGLSKPQGIAIAARSGCIAVACGGDGRLYVYDLQTLEEKAVVDIGLDADNVRYDASEDRIYVTFGDTESGGLAVLDARMWKKIREISFTSRPESFQLDSAGTRVFANLPRGIHATCDGGVAVADRGTGKIVAEVALKDRARNFPMAFDAAHERLFIACRRPARLIAIDTRQYAILAEAECAEDSDDLFYDAQTNRVLVIGGGFRPDMQELGDSPPHSTDETGAIDVFAVGPGGELTKVASTRTAPHARTGFFLPDHQMIYTGVPPREGRDSEIREYRFSGAKGE